MPDGIPLGWRIVKLLGRQTRAGFCSQIEEIGVAMVQVEVYRTGDAAPVMVERYTGSALFGFHDCTEQAAREWADRTLALPVHVTGISLSPQLLPLPYGG